MPECGSQTVHMGLMQSQLLRPDLGYMSLGTHWNVEADMNRWIWMALKMYAPMALVLVVAVVLSVMVSNLSEIPMVAGLASEARWLPMVAVVVALGFFLSASYRLWRWDRGQGPICNDCGGVLGHEREGRYGTYRRCLACSHNIAAWRRE